MVDKLMYTELHEQTNQNEIKVPKVIMYKTLGASEINSPNIPSLPVFYERKDRNFIRVATLLKSLLVLINKKK